MFDITTHFHVPSDSPLFDARMALDSMRPYAEWLALKSPLLAHWYLQGDSLQEALSYLAFDPAFNGHDAAVAVLHQRFKASANVSL